MPPPPPHIHLLKTTSLASSSNMSHLFYIYPGFRAAPCRSHLRLAPLTGLALSPKMLLLPRVRWDHDEQAFLPKTHLFITGSTPTDYFLSFPSYRSPSRMSQFPNPAFFAPRRNLLESAACAPCCEGNRGYDSPVSA